MNRCRICHRRIWPGQVIRYSEVYRHVDDNCGYLVCAHLWAPAYVFTDWALHRVERFQEWLRARN